nr:hypothetical protein GCM10025699_38340 [Microbacterium flavescens]
MRVLIVEDELYLAEAIRDGLRLEAIAADLAGDGDTALEQLAVNQYDVVVLDRDIPGPNGDEIARRLATQPTGPRVLMLTAADRLDDKATGFESGADDYLTKPFALRELVLRLRALGRRPAAGLRRCSSSDRSASTRSAAKCTATGATSRSPASSSPCSRCCWPRRAGS